MDSKEHQVGARWIPVSERLPPMDKNVLIAEPYGVSVGSRATDDEDSREWLDMLCCDNCGDPNSTWEVTHWMELPQPPSAASESQEQRSTECQSPDLASLAAQIRNLVIEECAVIAEGIQSTDDDWDHSYWDQAATCAAFRIRAAKEQG